MAEKPSLTVREAVLLALWELGGPIEKQDLIQRVLEIRPSSAKTAKSSIGNAIRWDLRHEALPLEDGRIIPINVALKDVHFRIPFSKDAIDHGAIPLTGFFPFISDITNPDMLGKLGKPPLTLRTSSDEQLPVKMSSHKMEIELPDMKPQTVTVPTVDLSEWLRAKEAKPGDSILVSIRDWEKRHYVLTWEPSGEKQVELIAKQNSLLVEKIYRLVGEEDIDHAWAAEIIQTAYAQLRDEMRGYPGDHWIQAVEADGRVAIGGLRILYLARYEEGTDYEPDGYEGEAEVHAPDLEKQGLVFVFQASLPYRKGLWRRLELLGTNTLGDFDSLMHTAFEHDWDHLSEFRIKPKDRGKRARWEGFGHHIPFERSAANEIQISQLGLALGDLLNYVYDFGDWIEHDIALEKLMPPEPGNQYPRIADRNKPKYENCVSCQERGIESRAIWDCIWCSNDQQRDILLCEECTAREHEDHDVEPILY